MENPTSPIQIDSSQSLLLNDSLPPIDNTHDITKEFLNQNQIINEEIMKYDQMLKTWPMFLYKLWTVLYVGFIMFILLRLNIMAFPFVFGKEIAGDLLLFSLLFILDSFFGFIIYGNVLLWIGLYKKDLLKVERSLTILKCFVLVGAINSLIAIPYQFIKDPSDLLTIFLSLFPTVISLVIYLPALYVKSVFEKRQVFQKFSSSPDHHV